MIPCIFFENGFLGNCLTFCLTFLPTLTSDDVLDCSGLLTFLSQMFNSEYFLSWEKKGGKSDTCQQWWELSVSGNTHFLFLHGRLAEIFEILSPVVSLIYFINSSSGAAKESWYWRLQSVQKYGTYSGFITIHPALNPGPPQPVCDKWTFWVCLHQHLWVPRINDQSFLERHSLEGSKVAEISLAQNSP